MNYSIATKTLRLEGFLQGQFMSWFMTTQAANKISVRLYDSKKEYVSASKQSTSITPPLSVGSGDIAGNNLTLEIKAENAEKLEAWFNNMKICSASSGIAVGNFFVLAGEDQVGGDEDYNDICISITAWNTKG